MDGSQTSFIRSLLTYVIVRPSPSSFSLALPAVYLAELGLRHTATTLFQVFPSHHLFIIPCTYHPISSHLRCIILCRPLKYFICQSAKSCSTIDCSGLTWCYVGFICSHHSTVQIKHFTAMLTAWCLCREWHSASFRLLSLYLLIHWKGNRKFCRPILQL